MEIRIAKHPKTVGDKLSSCFCCGFLRAYVFGRRSGRQRHSAFSQLPAETMKSLSGSSGPQYAKSAALFFFFASVGGVSIVLLKLYIDHPIIVEYIGGREVLTTISFPIVLMILYLIVTILPVFGFRLDQTGDNLYYLGFIYTLCSLSVALWKVARGASADEILQAFGLAIGSTIFGIAMRVVFNQRRTDVYEIEQATRLKLSESAARFTRELDEAVTELENFRSHAVQTVTDGFKETQERVDEIVERVLASYEKAAETDSEFRDELRSFVAAMKDSIQSRKTETERSEAKLNKLVELLKENGGLHRDKHDQNGIDLEQLLSDILQSTQKQVDEISKMVELVAASVTEERQVRSAMRRFTIDFKDKLEARDSGLEETVAAVRSIREDVAKSLDQSRKLNAEIKTCVDALSRPRANRSPGIPGSQGIDRQESQPGFWKRLFGSRR